MCSEEDTGFPKVLASNKNVSINSHFYGLLIEEVIDGITLEEYMQRPLSDMERVDFVLSEIRHAKTLYNDILESLTDDDRETYNRIKSNASHLDPWIMAIETFKNRISLI